MSIIRSNPWLAAVISRPQDFSEVDYPEIDSAQLTEAIAELELRLAEDGGTKVPPGLTDDDVCWYADEGLDHYFYQVRDLATSLGEEFDYPDNARLCCGQPVATCPQCEARDDFCLRHNGSSGECGYCEEALDATET